MELIKSDEQEVYAYSVEVILSTAVTLLSIYILAFVVHSVLSSSFFLLGFFVSRGFCGGYHAKHHFTCYLTSMLNYGLFLFFQAAFHITEYKRWMLYIPLFISLLSVLIFAPMDHPNNPMTDLQKKKGRKRASIFIVSFVCAICICNHFIENKTVLTAIVFGVFSTGVSLIIAFLERIKIRR